MTEIRREWFDHNGGLMAFEVGSGYLFYLAPDSRMMLYPPGEWSAYESNILFVPTHGGHDVTSPWSWWSMRKARRIIRRMERRVSRSMRTIYREHDRWRRNSPGS